MRTDKKIKSLAEKMFVEEGASAKAVANAFDLTEQTIGRWKRSEGWEKKRKDFLKTPFNIKKVLFSELSNMSAGEESNLDWKAINDAIKAIRAISDEVSIETVFSVLRAFDNWMVEQDPEAAISILEWHKLYILHLAKEQ